MMRVSRKSMLALAGALGASVAVPHIVAAADPTVVSLFADTLPLAVDVQGIGRPYLLLHSGAGPVSLKDLAASISRFGQAVVPTMPGFNGTTRPDWFTSIDDVVLAYLAAVDRLNLQNVVVVGNSVGGWVAAELALRASPRITACVLIDAVGLDPSAAGEVVDITKHTPDELMALVYNDKARALPPLPTKVADSRALMVYAGKPYMNSPSLRRRLPGMTTPTLVLWGDSDGIVTPGYGRQFATLIPGARFELVTNAGHFAQVEQLDVVAAQIKNFASAH
jgi:pimeloyl-ACP methyl ester carboxylesterase